MANDIEMFKDIEEHERNDEKEEAKLLMECYHYRFIEFNEKKSRELKQKYIKKFKYWGDYY